MEGTTVSDLMCLLHLLGGLVIGVRSIRLIRYFLQKNQ
jgi:hypothetical protein